MIISSLQVFATKIAARNRITFGDVRRLQRDILPDGVMSREEADLLLGLDAQVARADGAWADWLVAAIVDFAVWGERPTGTVEGEAARWITDALTRSGAPTRAGRRIAREIQREAVSVDEPIASLVPDAIEPPQRLAEARIAA